MDFAKFFFQGTDFSLGFFFLTVKLALCFLKGGAFYSFFFQRTFKATPLMFSRSATLDRFSH